MGVYLEIFLIATIVVNITDISGIVRYFEKWLQGWLDVKNEIHIKIIECSYCQTHWLGLLYLIIKQEFSLLTYTYLLLICACTPVIADMIWALRDFISILPKMIYRATDKISK